VYLVFSFWCLFLFCNSHEHFLFCFRNTSMLPGGIRRVIVPANLGYQSILSMSNPKCVEGENVGPIPPKNSSDGAYQRWYQFYCNPRIPYQPDLVLDIKLYRTN
jgi:hypothetical protein